MLTKGLVEEDEEGVEEAMPRGDSPRFWDDNRADEVNQLVRKINWVCALK